MFVFAVISTAVVVGCSTEARYRFKTIIFTGVPPLHEEQTEDKDKQQDPAQAAKAQQMDRQQQHREALISRYWQHGPFAAGQCERCHSLGQSQSFLGNRAAITEPPSSADSTSAPSRLTMPPQQLCITCHSQHGDTFAHDRELQQHSPVAVGECTGCHNPHQSLRQYMLHGADNRELCGGCHEPSTLSPLHAEIPAQDCIDCHNAHVGITSKLLRSDAGELTLLYGSSNND
jgi:predicted CXXCH cytochrome family protein